MTKTAIGRFRLVSFIEGVSAILLFFVAMPLKYGFDMPLAVTYVGLIHGILWMVYMGMLIFTWGSQGWSLSMFIAGLFAGLPPGGTFLFDHFMVKHHVHPE